MLCRPAAAGGLDIALTASAASAEHVRAYGVIGGWMRPGPLWQGRRWRLALRHELEMAVWQVPRARDLLDVGYSPAFELRRAHRGDSRSAADKRALDSSVLQVSHYRWFLAGGRHRLSPGRCAAATPIGTHGVSIAAACTGAERRAHRQQRARSRARAGAGGRTSGAGRRRGPPNAPVAQTVLHAIATVW